MLIPGAEIELAVEKPAAGGRMIARHEGQILLVSGAIPGERVVARIERVEKRLAFASTVRVIERSPDRRAATTDPRCGGCAYAHVAYPRQVALKADIVADAFTRIGRITLGQAVAVRASPESGYRMRARLHVQGGAAGFYREGTHDICDPRETEQLAPDSLAAVDAALAALRTAAADVAVIELSENLAGDERALHFATIQDARALDAALARAIDEGRLTGCTARGQLGPLVRAGDPAVGDPLEALTRGRASAGRLRRSPASFFQGNRFLVPDLVAAVLDATAPDGSVLDLYAGVGLFTVALAASGRGPITAIEGDRDSGHDLTANAAAYPAAIRALVGSVEEQAARYDGGADTIVVDPPRTGISREAMGAIVRLGAGRVVYVSCDPPTMARDARRLLDGGYALQSLQGFDLFPNTPHVETLGIFTR